MSTPADGVAAHNLWACRALRADGTTAWFAGVDSTKHADGEMVEVPEARARSYVGPAAVVVADAGPDGAITHIQVSTGAAPKAPPLWFAELPEPDASPPALNLVAFTGLGVQPGSLLDREALRATAARTKDQLGAVRIYPATGEVDQLYVTPAWRRQSVGTSLMIAAGMLVRARGWKDLWGDGQRTADGDRLTKASIWRHHVAPLTHLAPPMTPFEDR